MSIPHLFRCPISLDLFIDPVTLSTGQTYDRTSIEKWLAGGHTTCPVTMQRLDDMSVVPNLTLRHLIDQWILDKCSSASQLVLAGPIDHNEYSLASLKHSLQSKNIVDAAKLDILKKVKILVLESDTAKNCLIELGFFPLLLKMVFQSSVVCQSEIAEVGLDCVLCLLPYTELDAVRFLMEGLHLGSLMQLLDEGNMKIKSAVCYLLEAICTSHSTKELCQVIGQWQPILEVLIYLIHTTSEKTVSEAAVRAIGSICSVESNWPIPIVAGVVNGLIAYLESTPAQCISCAMATLEMLLGLEEGKTVVAKNKNAMKVLVKHVFAMPPDGTVSEQAIGALLIICAGSCRAAVEAVDCGILTQLLLLLQSQCSSRAKASARTLLQLLKSLCYEYPR